MSLANVMTQKDSDMDRNQLLAKLKNIPRSDYYGETESTGIRYVLATLDAVGVCWVAKPTGDEYVVCPVMSVEIYNAVVEQIKGNQINPDDLEFAGMIRAHCQPEVQYYRLRVDFIFRDGTEYFDSLEKVDSIVHEISTSGFQYWEDMDTDDLEYWWDIIQAYRLNVKE